MTRPADRRRSDDGPDADLRERLVDSTVFHRGRYVTFRVDQRPARRRHGRNSRRRLASGRRRDRCPRRRRSRAARPPVAASRRRRAPGDPGRDARLGRNHGRDRGSGRSRRPRELEEETGMRAGAVALLASFWTAPGFATELMHLYLATDLTSRRRGPARPRRGRAAPSLGRAVARGRGDGRIGRDLRREVDRRALLACPPQGARTQPDVGRRGRCAVRQPGLVAPESGSGAGAGAGGPSRSSAAW